jgi:signal transduction histidine kinase
MQQVRILITDDDTSVRNSLSKAVRRMGHTILEAESGETALQLLADLNAPAVDVLIADILMRKMSGIDLLKETRQLRPDMPVIIITGAATLESSISALNAGAFAYLLKPIQIEQVREVIARAVERVTDARAKQALEHQLIDRYQELQHPPMLIQTNQQNPIAGHDPLADLILGLRHELGNAITAIRLNLSVIEEEGQYGAPLKEHLKDLQTTTDELALILSRLKQYPNAPVNLELVDLRQVLMSLVDMDYARFERKQIQLDVAIPEHEIPVYGVEMELSRALKHILDNAIEATEQMTWRQIQVEVTAAADQVEVTISDSGPGFRDEAMNHLFSPGYTTKISGGVVRGLGLGLFITRATINLYGGRIWLNNRPEGGASIHIVLPLAQSLTYPITTADHQLE